jgi:hypothetical protein
MKSKTPIILTVALVILIVITLATLALNFVSDRTRSEFVVRNTLADIVLLLCICLFAGIVVMRGAVDYSKNWLYEVK